MSRQFVLARGQQAESHALTCDPPCVAGNDGSAGRMERKVLLQQEGVFGERDYPWRRTNDP